MSRWQAGESTPSSAGSPPPQAATLTAQGYAPSQLKSVVVGFDFTAFSESALSQAIRIARRNEARLRVVHVLENLVVTELEESLPKVQRDAGGSIADDARKAWTRYAASIPDSRELELEVEIGQPVDAMLRRVRDYSADLLVLGTHGTSKPTADLGTLAKACVRKAGTNVLLVRKPHASPFRSVMACIDFSDTSQRMLAQAIQLAAKDAAMLHVLHVFRGPWHRLHYRAPTPEASPDFQKQYTDGLRRRLEALCEPLLHEGDGLRPQYHLVDHPTHAAGIGESASRLGADLIVLGARSRRNVRDLLLGSTVEHVARDTPCSILVVKPAKSEGEPQT